MFERFTDRARSVLVLAQEEARLLNHSFIGTEHLLLGLIREGNGLGAKTLESLSITLPAVHQKIEETIGMAGSPSSGSPPFTPRGKMVLELSLREALQLGHSYIGTEHILLGLVREGEGVAATILVGLGADLGAVQKKLVELMSGFSDDENSGGVEINAYGAEPDCPRCRAQLAQVARYRTIAVPSGVASVDKEGILIDVVYCSQCGMTLHTFGSDQAVATGAMGHPKAPYGEPSITRRFPLRQRPSDIEQTGPPPTDEESARAAIRQAFADMGEIDEEKGNVPSVEGSEGLAACREQSTELARARYGQVPNVTVEFRVDAIWFVNDHEAVVTYTAQITGSLNITLGGRPGRAIVVGGEWKVTRDTYCEWVRTGGVECPPRREKDLNPES